MRFGEGEAICPRHCAGAARAKLIDIACDQERRALRLSAKARLAGETNCPRPNISATNFAPSWR